ncbi:MarR family transcriptional regulator [Nonomuraea sp. NPDC051191]|uniref:MarR family transcriptional regulator n=1 Tax=Nonomuraea sp. NPDC051191 TaxID=3364372 RepID=UPI0037A2CF1B
MLVEIARNPAVRLRDIATRVGITERAVQNIVTDLYRAGYLSRERVGRRNRYSLHLDRQFRYPTEAGLPVSLLIGLYADRDLPAGLHDRLPRRDDQSGRHDGGADEQ